MDNSKKVILDLCGGTGAWSRPYREAGYDVRLITLPEFDVTNVTLAKNVIFFTKQDGGFMAVDFERIQVYGILAAPPCTEFSIAKGARPRNFHEGMRTVEACMKIIWHVRKYSMLHFWALENPRGFLRQFLGIPKYTFEQWQFGGNKRKATDIWGYFNEPTSIIKTMPAGLTKKDCKSRVHASDWAKLECPLEYEDYISQFRGDSKRAALRAITPAGFSEAFYKSNK